MIGVLGDPEWLVCPGDEEPVDRKCRKNHGHADGGLDGGGDHWEDGDGRRQDDVDDGEEEVNLGKQRSRKTITNDKQRQSSNIINVVFRLEKTVFWRQISPIWDGLLVQ